MNRRVRTFSVIVLAGLAVMVALGVAGWYATGALRDSLIGESGGSAFGQGVAKLELLLLLRAGDLTAPAGQGEVEFEVAANETVESVAVRLESEGLIKSADAFRRLARLMGLDRGIQAGTHLVPRGVPAENVLEALQLGTRPGIVVRIPEGLRVEEIAELFDAAGVAGGAGFAGAARSSSALRNATDGFVAARPAGAGLEGYLFPDTYEVAPETTAEGLVQLLAQNFQRRYNDLAAEAELLDLTHHDVVILASIVEREAVLASERPRIGRVFRNRLEEPPYLLGADPTVQYALGLQAEPRQWWKRPLTLEDLQSASPYNTYVHPGLPPGPIASPGRASLEGVVRAEDGPWMYFVANEEMCDGSHVFAVTFEEHQANVARYRTGRCVP